MHTRPPDPPIQRARTITKNLLRVPKAPNPLAQDQVGANHQQVLKAELGAKKDEIALLRQREADERRFARDLKDLPIYHEYEQSNPSLRRRQKQHNPHLAHIAKRIHAHEVKANACERKVKILEGEVLRLQALVNEPTDPEKRD